MRSVRNLPEVNARLFLVGKTLSEDVATSYFLDGIVSLDSQEFANAFADLLPARQVVQVTACVFRLLCNPFSRSRRILLFEPAIRIGDGYTMKDLSDGFGRRIGRRYSDSRHGALLSATCMASRYMRRVRLRKYPATAGSCRDSGERHRSLATA